MTIPDLITTVLDKIRRDFYQDKPARDFVRDERQLTRAIATYGYKCHELGWNFDVEFIYQELMELLLKIRIKKAPIKYFPIYLEGAVKRHIGQRAEELSAKAKQIDHKIAKLLAQVGQTVSAAEIRQPKPVEILAEVFRGVKKIQKSKRAARRPAKDKQEQLL